MNVSKKLLNMYLNHHSAKIHSTNKKEIHESNLPSKCQK